MLNNAQLCITDFFLRQQRDLQLKTNISPSDDVESIFTGLGRILNVLTSFWIFPIMRGEVKQIID